MKVVLFSNDEALFEMCREVLAELQVNDLELERAPEARPNRGGDLRIWDFEPGKPMPTAAGQEFGDLFLVARRHLAEFQKQMPWAEASILLKPATRSTLRAFLDAATRRWQKSAAEPGVRSLRADRDELLQCLLQANLRLQESDQDRTNFLARALHDFRSPLTALQGYCGMLLQEQLGTVSTDQREVLRRMEHSIERLSRMASAMFELSVRHKMERKPDLERGSLEACVQNAVHQILPKTHEKDISVSLQLSQPDAEVYLDAEKIEQVLLNMLENACKFTPRQGVIQVGGYVTTWDARRGRAGAEERLPDDRGGHNAYRIDVRDSGTGIRPERLETVFEEYTSYAGPYDRSGTGLGLAICKMIIAGHRGAIWAESNAEGTTFSFVLPLAQEAPLRRPVEGVDGGLSIKAVSF